jgi:hypothetical protein
VNTILAPVLALVGWTFVIWLWMYITRIPAMQKAKIDAGKIKQKSDLDPLPISVKQVADNYNHLHEQPTLFYAVALTAFVSNADNTLIVTLAWAYVGARVAHSMIQCTFNYVPVRFLAFIVGSLVLIALTYFTAAHVLANF